MKHLPLAVILLLIVSCNKSLTEPLIGDAGVEPPVYGADYGDVNIVDGYLERFSLNNSDSLEMYINARAVTDSVKLAVYDGAGKVRFALSINGDSLIPQKPTTDNPPEDGFGYRHKVTARVNLVSGFYTIGKKIPFIVKDTTKMGKVVVVYPSNTVNAYNTAGGRSTYTADEATTVSFQRPVPYVDQFLGGWLKVNQSIRGDFDWIEDRDMDDYSWIENYKVLVIVGHSEYWTRQARINLDRFIASGGNVVILSGNSIWWQVRYSDDKTKMIAYKDEPGEQVAPLDRTIQWNSPELQYPITPSIGAEFNNAGYGIKEYTATGIPLDAGWDGYKILAPSSPLFAGLNLSKGDILSCPGKEWDGAPVFMWEGAPILDTIRMGMYKAELLAYDMVTRSATKNTNSVGTMIVFKRTPTSGTVVNVCNTNWCAANGLTGVNGAALKQITINAINGLANGRNLFTY